MREFHPYTKPSVNERIVFFWITAVSFVISVLIGLGVKHIITPEILNSLTAIKVVELLFAGYPILIFEALYWLFNRCLWRFFYRSLIIEGNYEGTFKSSYDNFRKEREVRIKVRQKFNEISITWEVPGSSKSWSINASLEKISPNSVRLIYNYRNEPTGGTVESPTQNIHYGTAILYFENDKLEGKYFTSERPNDSGNQVSNWGIVQAEKLEQHKRGEK